MESSIVNSSAESNFSKNYSITDEVYFAWSATGSIIFTVSYIAIIIVTAFGNVLTVAAFVMYKDLRTFHNTYICNLAIADAAVGIISMPIGVYVFYSLDWDWTSVATWVCKSWLFIDYVVTSVGALFVALISYDRYCLVAQGVKYMTSQTMFKVRVRCCVIWASGIVVLAPGILFFDMIQGTQNDEWKCLVEFRHDIAYTTIVIVYNFLLPLGMVAIFNFLLHLQMRKRSAKFRSGNDQEDSRLKRDKRAARSLTILVLALVVCWLPWQIITILDIICGGCIPHQAFDVCIIIFWFNSCINPVLYALNYPKFRQTFRKMLIPWKKAQVQDINSTQTQSTNE